MARDRGLFERLREPEQGGQRSALQRTDAVYESVRVHLGRMLNTRYDDSAAVPDYGLPSIVDLDLVNRGEDLRRAIEQTIRSYEPRIDNVRVHRVPADAADRWKVRFQITARPVADKKVKFQYDAVVDSSGAWKVTS